MQHYGNVPYDLASSGIPNLDFATDIGEAPNVEDTSAVQKLREAIAKHNDVPLTDVLAAQGTSHSIFLAYAAIASVGDQILVEDPGYEPLTLTAEGLGIQVRTYPRPAPTFQVDPSEVAARVTPKTRAIVVTNLHNPTGVRTSNEVLRELARIAEARGAYLIVDEVYAEFDELGAVFTDSARKLAPNVIAISSLTKCYGAGNYRLGWVLGPPDVIASGRNAVIGTCGHYPLSYGAYGAAVFSKLDHLGKRALTIAAGKRALAEKWVASIPNALWSTPKEGLYGLVTLAAQPNLRERIEQHAKTAGVLVGAGSFFNAPNSFRLSWATTDTKRFAEALELLRPLCSSSPT